MRARVQSPLELLKLMDPCEDRNVQFQEGPHSPPLIHFMRHLQRLGANTGRRRHVYRPRNPSRGVLEVPNQNAGESTERSI